MSGIIQYSHQRSNRQRVVKGREGQQPSYAHTSLLRSRRKEEDVEGSSRWVTGRVCLQAKVGAISGLCNLRSVQIFRTVQTTRRNAKIFEKGKKKKNRRAIPNTRKPGRNHPDTKCTNTVYFRRSATAARLRSTPQFQAPQKQDEQRTRGNPTR